MLAGFGQFAYFLGRATTAAVAAVASPRDVARHLFRTLAGAAPLAAVAGAALGVVLWLHLRGILVRFGGASAVEYLPTALALAVTLEFGPIGAGLIVAGRAGASLGAELGAMQQTEQIDALELLGASPARLIVGPRVLACALALPLLTVLIDGLALFSSFAAEALASGITAAHYEAAILRGLRVEDVVPATLKTVAFGVLTGAAGCYHGLRCTGGTAGVGRAATRGVVGAILGVLVSNVLLVRLIQWWNG